MMRVSSKNTPCGRARVDVAVDPRQAERRALEERDGAGPADRGHVSSSDHHDRRRRAPSPARPTRRCRSRRRRTRRWPARRPVAAACSAPASDHRGTGGRESSTMRLVENRSAAAARQAARSSERRVAERARDQLRLGAPQVAGDAVVDDLGRRTGRCRDDGRPARERLDHHEPERLGPLHGVEQRGRSPDEVELVLLAELAHVLDVARQQRARPRCSKYSCSRGSRSLAAIFRGMPASRAMSAASRGPFSRHIRPTKLTYPPSPAPTGTASTSRPWWITAAIGMPSAVEAWWCEIATIDTPAHGLVTAGSSASLNGPWLVVTTGGTRCACFSSGPATVWSWIEVDVDASRRRRATDVRPAR